MIKLTLKEAIEILEAHNKWRRWDGKGKRLPMQDVYLIGQAIDLVVNKYKRK